MQSIPDLDSFTLLLIGVPSLSRISWTYWTAKTAVVTRTN